MSAIPPHTEEVYFGRHAHARRAREPLRHVRQEEAGDEPDADLPTAQQREADNDRLGDRIEQGARRDGRPAALDVGFLRLFDTPAAAVAVLRAALREQPVDTAEDESAQQEAADGRERAAFDEGLLHQVDRQHGDQHTATEAHHRGDQTMWQLSEEGDCRADEQPGTGEQSPQAG